MGVSNPGHECTDATAVALADHCLNVTTVDLHGAAGVTNVGVTALATALPGLRRISLKKTQVSTVGVRRLAQKCSRLTRVVLAETHVDDDGVLALVEQCPLLDELDLFGCALVTEVAIDHIATHATNLRSLFVSADLDQVAENQLGSEENGIRVSVDDVLW